ncbi:hypothetical protein [Streptomyces glycanivorans]|uniref:Uncharacterized protein n=1 Tax=Streptomyces glycanivorans TaxID=3033808 RepID=A0ABY9JRU1_9ACTN|nr:hypothetical protein [Streptomyces sp. Alt3]WLQ69401.1 hypothetical protein P8A20_38495 [Streptomyces sp. Alt3]
MAANIADYCREWADQGDYERCALGRCPDHDGGDHRALCSGS